MDTSRRRLKDTFARISMRASVLFINVLGLAIFCGLLVKAGPILARVPLVELLFSTSWHPMKGSFGLFPFIVGTAEVTLIAMLISIPLCLLCAIYLTEYVGRRSREAARFIIDILAGIPSVIYGLFGVLVIVPVVRAIGESMDVQTTGYSLLAGGLILAIMVIPFIISISLEVLRMVPGEDRESALALGATKWETIKHVVLRKAYRGLLASVVLGFARAFGETMAVLMVVGNVAEVPSSVFDPAYPLPALIANNYGEVMSIPLYDSALMTAAFILMSMVAGFSLTAHYALQRIGLQGHR